MKKLFLYIFLLFLTINANANLDSLKIQLVLKESIRISKSYYATAGEMLKEPFTVFILDSAKHPIPNIPVVFNIVSHPEKEKHTFIEQNIVYSDSTGKAETNIRLGSSQGNYIFSAHIKNYSGEIDPIYLSVIARKDNWVAMLIMGVIGGLGLFLYGMHMLSNGLKKTAGNKMRSILNTVTTNRFVAVGIGTIVTMITQSSSATTVMLVSFVQAKLISFTQTMGIVLGAGIGTTITLQLIAFKLTDYSLLIIGIGFMLYFFFSAKKIKNVGESIFGFGILFFGMYIMSDSMEPLRTFQPFIDIVLQLENPILGILIGTLFTALIQSSAAFLGIVLVFSMQGLISLEASIPLIFGANIGTTVTALLATINSNRDAKRVALSHTFFKVFAVILFVWWIPTFTELIKSIPPTINGNETSAEMMDVIIPRQIANAHTVFNVLFTLAFLPFLKPIANLLYKILPDKEEEEIAPYKTRFLEDSLISTPTLALNLAKAEVLEFAEKVKRMSEIIIIPFFEDNEQVLDEVKELEKEVDYLQHKTAKYLTKISQQDIDENTAEESFQILQCSAEFEIIADLISTRLRNLAKKRIRFNLAFSNDGKAELTKFHSQTVKQVARAIDVFKDTKFERGKKLEQKYQKYKAGELNLKRSHFDRLRQDIPEAIQTNEMHLELIDILLRINRHAALIGRIMMGALEAEDENEVEQNNK
ncbi:MAG: Na/Pi symporter [Melioribacteraceae bacterium]|nr:MAG: Na/Pi symporter [Melioribacteraceae bacterium]